MPKKSWTTPTTQTQAHRRAGARRRYNAQRRKEAEARRLKVEQLFYAYPAAAGRQGAGGGSGSERGVGQWIADQLGVHPSTVSRDLAAIRQFYQRAPHAAQVRRVRRLGLLL